ncbi:MAG: 50S ribosomal protein L17 [Ignavibacteria bacterium]|nr:50S ribosomal protein L17 [Ignavibacteria bacterium]
MIHRRKGRKLKRTASHKKALLSNLSVALIKSKKIRTTLAKAKELRTYIEPIITKSRKALNSSKPEYGVHLRREVNSFLQDRSAVKMLFEEIALKVKNRNGGYTRVLKMGRRLGDGAELALIELVDYNLEQNPQKTEPAEKEIKGKQKGKTKTETESKNTSSKSTSGKTASKNSKSSTEKSKKTAEEKVTKKTKGRKTKETAE